MCACLGTTPRFQNDLGVRVLMILIDFVSYYLHTYSSVCFARILIDGIKHQLLMLVQTAAFFTMGTGWAIFGIVVMEMVDQACPQAKCNLSIVYGSLVWLAGATGGVAACCHMAVIAKLRRQHHA